MISLFSAATTSAAVDASVVIANSVCDIPFVLCGKGVAVDRIVVVGASAVNVGLFVENLDSKATSIMLDDE